MLPKNKEFAITHVRKRQDESSIYTKAKILDILGGTP